jgi:branched-subunit amino acid transport protein
VALSLAVSVILMPVAWFINRYLPFMVGRKPRRKTR